MTTLMPFVPDGAVMIDIADNILGLLYLNAFTRDV